MSQMIQANWLLVAVLLVIALLIAVWLFGRATRSSRRERQHRPDVLDEGAAPAQRNQALIDAPPAVAPPSVPVSPIVPTAAAATTVDTMGGLGEMLAAGTGQAAVEEGPPAWQETDAAAERAAASGDELGRLKGVGPKLVAALHAMGITRFDQIAGWTDADVARMDAALPAAFQGRIVRDSWVEQARFLATGDVAGYEGKFGKL